MGPLIIFCWGGVRLVEYLGLPGYFRLICVILGVVVMICSFVRFFAGLIEMMNRRDKAEAEKLRSSKDLTIGADVAGSEKIPLLPRDSGCEYKTEQDKQDKQTINRAALITKSPQIKNSKAIKKKEQRLRLIRAQAMLEERRAANTQSAAKPTEPPEPTEQKRQKSAWEQFAEDTADRQY
ncbi:hypothetical protein FACS1894120_3900 [Clostridia bacterium]|nr:hypothetical protein FACS1894120_3900 [Clostridia bacterium]